MSKTFNFKYRLFFSVVFIQLFLFNCCPDTEDIYYDLSKFQITNFSITNDSDIKDMDTINSKDLRIKLFLDYDNYYASNFGYSLFKGNNLYAFACSPSYKGLNKDIQNIELNYSLSGSNEKNSISTENLKFYKSTNYDDIKNQRESYEDWLNIINNGESNPSRDWFIELANFSFTPNIANQNIEFELIITFIDNTSINSKTNAVVIK